MNYTLYIELLLIIFINIILINIILIIELYFRQVQNNVIHDILKIKFIFTLLYVPSKYIFR